MSDEKWPAALRPDAAAFRREYLGWPPMTPLEGVLAEAQHRLHRDAEFCARVTNATDIVHVAIRQFGSRFDDDRVIAAVALVLADRDPVTLKAVDR